MEAEYYEAHITIAPVFEKEREEFIEIAKQWHFRVADLLMQKDATGPGELSRKDAFCTGRGTTFESMKQRMNGLVSHLRHVGFRVYRAKIEAVVFDERYVPANIT